MGDKEWRDGWRMPTQDPSTNNRWLSVGAEFSTTTVGTTGLVSLVDKLAPDGWPVSYHDHHMLLP